MRLSLRSPVIIGDISIIRYFKQRQPDHMASPDCILQKDNEAGGEYYEVLRLLQPLIIVRTLTCAVERLVKYIETPWHCDLRLNR
jgi:hypothetical protein